MDEFQTFNGEDVTRKDEEDVDMTGASPENLEEWSVK